MFHKKMIWNNEPGRATREILWSLPRPWNQQQRMCLPATSNQIRLWTTHISGPQLGVHMNRFPFLPTTYHIMHWCISSDLPFHCLPQPTLQIFPFHSCLISHPSSYCIPNQQAPVDIEASYTILRKTEFYRHMISLIDYFCICISSRHCIVV